MAEQTIAAGTDDKAQACADAFKPIAQVERYFVDERAGCIAVRDRLNTDPDYRGLHWDTEGVVRYAHGTFDEAGWIVADADRDEAHGICERLNRSTGEIGDALRALAHAEQNEKVAEERAKRAREHYQRISSAALTQARP